MHPDPLLGYEGVAAGDTTLDHFPGRIIEVPGILVPVRTETLEPGTVRDVERQTLGDSINEIGVGQEPAPEGDRVIGP